MATIVTTGTIYTLIAQLSCDQVCIDFQWLLYSWQVSEPKREENTAHATVSAPLLVRDEYVALLVLFEFQDRLLDFFLGCFVHPPAPSVRHIGNIGG
ncbi:hypothetical protein EA473_13570 [Natrarchaeobius chitinivorans]|uniref:Uncharacterized protein n=1 Tax=Natrarchaeobius chitinivorans TaxID=1679083 RepID=A0A3N6P6R8_NATCH|nr:hypothetical protein EA473_13570 [Natrarchaeobius chitinivorans]